VSVECGDTRGEPAKEWQVFVGERISLPTNLVKRKGLGLTVPDVIEIHVR
jgi:hypothetical protein